MKGYLNIGCGARYHPDWTNVDVASSSPHILAHDCRNGIPFSVHSFEAVYHSHVLEHFPKHEALHFLQECHRVLKPKGIIRIAVPDLETIARLYLTALEKVSSGDAEWQPNYDWMTLEIFDQSVREQPGGGLLEYLRQQPIPNEAFILSRASGEVRRIIESQKTRAENHGQDRTAGYKRFSYAGRFVNYVYDRFIRLLLGKRNYRALAIGRFRLSGEIHYWMYDRFSLARLLESAGFLEAGSVGPIESRIPGWANFHLDTEPDGTIYKPDSIYLEAIKP